MTIYVVYCTIPIAAFLTKEEADKYIKDMSGYRFEKIKLYEQTLNINNDNFEVGAD